METTYRIKAQNISMTFLKSLKTVDPEYKREFTGQNELLEMVKRNRQNAPVISPDIDIQALIEESQCPE